MVKLPDDSSEKMSPRVRVSVSLVLAVIGVSRDCWKLFNVPFFKRMNSLKTGFPMEGKSMTVALLIWVPSVERTRGKATVPAVGTGCAV